MLQHAISKMVSLRGRSLRIDRTEATSLLDLITASEIVRAGGPRVARRRKYHAADGRCFEMIVRARVPFYRPPRWYEVVRGLYDMAIGYKVTCVVLRKKPEAADSDRGLARAGCRLRNASHEAA